MELLHNFINETFNLWLNISPYLLLGILFSGLMHIYLGKDFISNHLGKGGFLSILKATLFGIPLPVCSCGVIPLASSLKKDGAHKSSVMAFLVSTPTTGIDSFLTTYSLLGPLFAIFRPLGALIAGIFLGVADYFFEGKTEKVKEIPKHRHIKTSMSSKLKELLRYCLLEIPKDIGKWLFLGTILGGLISAVIPKELFSRYLSFPFDFIITLVISIPLYVCATGSIPIAASLIHKGFSPGAGLVFLIAGPATNAITLSFVRATFGKRSFYIYLISIVFVSITLGLLLNLIWFSFDKNPEFITGVGGMMAFKYKLMAGIVLFMLILNSLFKAKPIIKKIDLEICVSDIHCTHCKFTLENQLKELEGVDNVVVDVKKKMIMVQGKIKRDILLKKIKDAGYTPF
ncbi:MAG: permease [Candidatus Omnitrophica bacterium]|nr:permease [Candidatus Omnitrophota bacterium]